MPIICNCNRVTYASHIYSLPNTNTHIHTCTHQHIYTLDHHIYWSFHGIQHAEHKVQTEHTLGDTYINTLSPVQQHIRYALLRRLFY